MKEEKDTENAWDENEPYASRRAALKLIIVLIGLLILCPYLVSKGRELFDDQTHEGKLFNWLKQAKEEDRRRQQEAATKMFEKRLEIQRKIDQERLRNPNIKTVPRYQ